MQPNSMMVAPLLQNELHFDDSSCSDTVLEHVEKILQNLSVDEAPDIDGVPNVVMWEVVSLVA